jgi:organic radical activating enzyme
MKKLPVMEQFYTIQGEGVHQGRAAYFIRLAGCDVGCVWCDVKESWEAGQYQELSVSEIVNALPPLQTKLVVITGGEPLMYDLTELTQHLQALHYKTHLETSGAYPLSGSWDWICFSPKKFKAPLAAVAEKADELKIIVYNKSDFSWAELHAKTVNPACKLYLQPEWSREQEMVPHIVAYCKANPQWRISLQLHKYLRVP